MKIKSLVRSVAIPVLAISVVIYCVRNPDRCCGASSERGPAIGGVIKIGGC
jgi:hypothetical protein